MILQKFRSPYASPFSPPLLTSKISSIFFLILCCYSFPGDSGVDIFGCDGLMVRGPARRSVRRLRLGVVFPVVDGSLLYQISLPLASNSELYLTEFAVVADLDFFHPVKTDSTAGRPAVRAAPLPQPTPRSGRWSCCSTGHQAQHRRAAARRLDLCSFARWASFSIDDIQGRPPCPSGRGPPPCRCSSRHAQQPEHVPAQLRPGVSAQSCVSSLEQQCFNHSFEGSVSWCNLVKATGRKLICEGIMK
nr:uncharacterized protein LOC127293646 [Lolium perenne]